jgi:hypothetical protein
MIFCPLAYLVLTFVAPACVHFVPYFIASKNNKMVQVLRCCGFEEQLAAIEVLGKHLLRTVTSRLTRLSSGAGY